MYYQCNEQTYANFKRDFQSTNPIVFFLKSIENFDPYKKEGDLMRVSEQQCSQLQVFLSPKVRQLTSSILSLTLRPPSKTHLSLSAYSHLPVLRLMSRLSWIYSPQLPGRQQRLLLQRQMSQIPLTGNAQSGLS